MTQTRWLRCPLCSQPVDPYLNVDGRDDPRDWMPCLCGSCGEILTFDHLAPGGLRVPTDGDWVAWAADPLLAAGLDVAQRAGQRLKDTAR